MGGLARVMPLTARTYFIACLAITAAPIPLFAGFWSKDEILWKALNTENIGTVPGALIYVMGLAAAARHLVLHVAQLLPHVRGASTPSPRSRTRCTSRRRRSPTCSRCSRCLSIVAGVVFGFSPHLWGGHGEPLLEAVAPPGAAARRVRFAEPGSASSTRSWPSR